jgi:phospholipase/carboxylesterase
MKLRVHARQPRSCKADSAVVLFHGYGADGADLIGLADYWGDLLPTTEFLAPDAPNACDMSPFGFQWFPLPELSLEACAKGVRAAAPVVDNFIDDVLQTRQLPANRLAIVGFSQGTMLSLYVAPRRAEKVAGVLGFSGLLVDADQLPEAKKSSPEFLLFHGTLDPVVPFQSMDAAVRGLKAAGLEVSSVSCPGLGHGIDETGLRQGGAFLKKILGA